MAKTREYSVVTATSFVRCLVVLRTFFVLCLPKNSINNSRYSRTNGFRVVDLSAFLSTCTERGVGRSDVYSQSTKKDIQDNASNVENMKNLCEIIQYHEYYGGL